MDLKAKKLSDTLAKQREDMKSLCYKRDMLQVDIDELGFDIISNEALLCLRQESCHHEWCFKSDTGFDTHCRKCGLAPEQSLIEL